MLQIGIREEKKQGAISASQTKEQSKEKKTTQSGRETKNGDGEKVVTKKKWNVSKTSSLMLRLLTRRDSFCL